MTPQVAILPLGLNSPDVATVAAWIMATWGRLPIHDYFEALDRGEPWMGSLPRTLVAHVEGLIVGTVSVLLDDLETRPDINPWLGCLYVVPGYRRRGIGASLLLSGEEMAIRELGISTLYLFTDNQMALYAKFGWDVLESDHYHGQRIAIMAKRLGGS